VEANTFCSPKDVTASPSTAEDLRGGHDNPGGVEGNVETPGGDANTNGARPSSTVIADRSPKRREGEYAGAILREMAGANAVSAGADNSTFTAGAVRAEEMAGANIISAGTVTVEVTAGAEVTTAGAEK
jgi:hypothetical protein